MKHPTAPSEAYSRFARQFDAQIWRPRSPDVEELLGAPLEDALTCYPPGMFRAQNRAGHAWVVEAHILDCDAPPNAFVGKEAGLYCIGMPVSTPVHFLGLARRLFADPALFPFISGGEPATGARPATDRELIGWPHEQVPGPKAIDAADFERAWPLSENRSALAVWLGQLAVQLIWHHEFGHIATGHVDFLAEANGRTNLGEVFPGAADGALPDQQVMEIYADDFAVQPLLRRMISLHDRGRTRHYLTMTQHAAMLRFAHFMVNASWCLSDIWSERRLGAPLAADSHPPSAYRLFFGNEHLSDVMRALGLGDEVVDGSEALYSEAIRQTNSRIEDFAWVAEALSRHEDALFDYAYRMRNPEAFFARWQPYAFFH